MARVDLNCDLGEGAGNDSVLMPLVTSANIACGVHAGDGGTMRASVELAMKHNVAIGAHPSLDDREDFGRRELPVTPADVRMLVLMQTRVLQAVARSCGVKVVHVKPHGALYNMAARDAALAAAVADATFEADPQLVLFGLAGSELVKAGSARGLRVANEVFADRTYQSDGSLTPRSQPNAMIHEANASLEQVKRMVFDHVVNSTDGNAVRINADTVCLHGDGPHATYFATKLNHELRKAGVELKAFTA